MMLQRKERRIPESGWPTFFSIDPDLRFEDLRLHDFVRYWESKRRNGLLPSRADIDPTELRPFWGKIFMLDVVGDPRRFRYRLVGTHIVELVGRDSTGKFQEEVQIRRRITT